MKKNRPFYEDDPPAKIPGWALTYIDLMWMLLIFFILRCAVSEVSEGRRYREMASALKKQFGIIAEVPAPEETNDKKRNRTNSDRTNFRELVKEGFDDASDAKKRTCVNRGLLQFAEGSEKLQSEQRQILQALAAKIDRLTDTIEIRGELVEQAAPSGKNNRPAVDSAYARCIETRDYLVKMGIEPSRLRIAVDGQPRPQGEKPSVRLYSITEIAAEKPAKTPIKR